MRAQHPRPEVPHRRRLVLGTLAAVAAISLALSAVPRAGGDAGAGAGERLSLACAACHGASDPASDTPRLAGQREAYLAGQLRAFRQGERANPLMDAIARQLSDADIHDLAAFWSGQPAGSDARPSREVDAIKQSHMAFPPNFPSGFVLYLTLNDAEHKLVKKHYINTLGFETARGTRPLPYGTVLIQVNYRARLGPDQQPVLDDHSAWVADTIASYTGMESRAGWGKDLPAWLRNADWNYGTFTADRRPNRDANQAVCLACHARQAQVSYLFTFSELWDAARGR